MTDLGLQAQSVQATSAKPFPSGTIVPRFSQYKYATGCQTIYAEIIGGFPYYFPAYGTAMPSSDGNFVCHAACFKLSTEGKYLSGALPYGIAINS